MSDEGGGPLDRVARLGASPTFSGYAHILTVVFGFTGSMLLGVIGWTASQAYTAFNEQRQEIIKVEKILAGYEVDHTFELESIRRIGAIQADHERRLSRTEALVPGALWGRDKSPD